MWSPKEFSCILPRFLPVSHAIGWSVVAAPFVMHGALQVNKQN